MNITIIDGHGGLLGAQLVKEILAQIPNANITAVGTNANATAAMLKAGADHGATGENPVIVGARKADMNKLNLPQNAVVFIVTLPPSRNEKIPPMRRFLNSFL